MTDLEQGFLFLKSLSNREDAIEAFNTVAEQLRLDIAASPLPRFHNLARLMELQVNQALYLTTIQEHARIREGMN